MRNLLLFLIIAFTACRPAPAPDIIQTVTGEIRFDQTGVTLTHEHLLVDFIGAELSEPPRYNVVDAYNIILPHLMEIKNSGVKTFVDCSPKYLGRNPQLLKDLSEASGIQIITNTGFYGAINNQYIPEPVQRMPAETIAAFWIAEFQQGIDGTGVKPGFIKIGVETGDLSPFHQTLVKAAALTHRATGLTIMSHTGYATPAFQQLEILANQGVAADAFIWTHAQMEKDLTLHVQAAKLGAFISIDGFSGDEKEAEVISNMVVNLKKHNVLHKLLLSQDAGWFDPDQPDGQNYRSHNAIFTVLIPALNRSGINDADINQILVKNPGKAFAIKKRVTDPM